MIEPNKEEAQALKEAQYFESLESSPAWTLIKSELEGFVKEAHDQMVAMLAPSPEMALSAFTRYQQRLAAKNTIFNLIEDHKENKKQILETLEEPSGDDDARDYERA